MSHHDDQAHKPNQAHDQELICNVFLCPRKTADTTSIGPMRVSVRFCRTKVGTLALSYSYFFSFLSNNRKTSPIDVFDIF